MKRLVVTIAMSIAAGVVFFFEGIKSTYLFVEEWLLDEKHAGYGVAVARMLLGVTFAGAGLTNFATRNYTYGAGAAWTGQLAYPSSDFAKIVPFSFVTGAATSPALVTVLWLAMIGCAVLFMIGWRTKLIMFPLFVLWVGLVNTNLYVQDQSDNLTRMAMLVMLFMDPGYRWSLDARRRAKAQHLVEPSVFTRLRWSLPIVPSWCSALFHNLGVVILSMQICFVYAAGGLFKAEGKPWQDGTAVYAPIHTQQFGTWPILSDLVTAWGPAVGIATIGTVLIQVSFPLLLLRRPTRIFGLFAIMMFHVGIAVLMGLPWFSLSMIALDMIFIRDVTWLGMFNRVAGLWRGTIAQPQAAEPDEVTDTAADADADAETPDDADAETAADAETPADADAETADADTNAAAEREPSPTVDAVAESASQPAAVPTR